MSIPSYTMECDRCDYIAGSGITLGRFEYEMPWGRNTIHRSLGWCNQCRGFQAIENFELDAFDENWMWDDIESIEKSLLPNTWTYLCSRLSGSYRQTSSSMETVRKHMQDLIICARRKGTERCLSCGSTDHQAFDVAVTLEYDGFFNGKQQTDFIHPGCGGHICLVGSDMRFNWSFRKIRVYSPDGGFIRFEEESEQESDASGRACLQT